jgi:hypothetical protein
LLRVLVPSWLNYTVHIALTIPAVKRLLFLDMS